MPNIIISVDKALEQEMRWFPWVNWSKMAREELIQKDIFERYIKSKGVTDEDWEYCEKMDWHPVDWLPLKESFVKKLEKLKNEKPVKFKSVAELLEKAK